MDSSGPRRHTALLKWKAVGRALRLAPSVFPRASHHFAGVGVRVAQRHVAVQVHLVVVADELEDGDVEAAGEGHAVLRHPDGVVLRVRTPGGGKTHQPLRAKVFIGKISSGMIYSKFLEIVCLVKQSGLLSCF